MKSIAICCLFLAHLVLSSGCAHRALDVVDLPQNISYFTDQVDVDLDLHTDFKKEHFSVWSDDLLSYNKDIAMWGYRAFTPENSYAQNLQLYSPSFFDKIAQNSNFDQFMSVKKRAIARYHLNLRAMPTSKPLFKNPSKAGEGFPFDYLQNSTLYPQTPLLISHYSKDREWVYVYSSLASGWVKSYTLFLVDSARAMQIRSLELLFITKEGEVLKYKDGSFAFRSKIGMVLPLLREESEYFVTLVLDQELLVSKQIASRGALRFNALNLKQIIQEVSSSIYGWGGAYEERDCSSLLRDIFVPFGIWLPRNSSAQSRVGEVVLLKDLDHKQKIAQIKKRAKPFRTLLYQPGHISLYMGVYKGEPIVLHNIWGIRTVKNKKEGRVVIGKTISSTLKVGSGVDGFDHSSMMLHKISSMSIIGKDRSK